jgi:RND family efflux transporter MFP subunit
MSGRETRSLLLGVIVGLAVTAGAFVAWNRTQAESVQLPQPSQEDAHNDVVPTAPDPIMAIQMTAEEQQQIGLQTAEVSRQPISEEILATGRVEEAETSVRTVSARIGGRIDRLLVNFTGQTVRAGQPVAEIYSPEIFTAAEEYRLAIENRRHLAASRQADAIAQADALVDASRRRLALWGLSSEQIDELLTSPDAAARVTIHTSFGGTIRTRNVTEGQYVNAGEALFDVIDLGTVWVKADVFQADIGRIRPGLRAQITSDALPGTTLRGTVDFIELQSDLESRTTPVRVQVANPGMRLRPGMFVRASFQLSAGRNVLTIPRSAVIDTGSSRIVYLALPDGVFEQRNIDVGTATDTHYAVLKGLSEGDRVVTNGAFLIDSQTRLNGGMAGLFGGSTSFAQPAEDGPSPTYRISLRTEPDPPAGAQDNAIRVSVLDASNSPVIDAEVRMTIVMPAMPSMGMPEMRSSAQLAWNGSEYRGTISVGMAGPWNAVIEARRGNQLLATYQTRFNAR